MSNRNHRSLKDLVCAKEKYQTVLYAIPSFDIESTDIFYTYAHTVWDAKSLHTSPVI